MVSSIPVGSLLRAVSALAFQGSVPVAHDTLAKVVYAVIDVTKSAGRRWVLQEIVVPFLYATL